MTKNTSNKGFTLVQVAIALTAASLLAVAVLPTANHPHNIDNSKINTTKMNAVMTALRQYQATNSVLPCPADPNLALGDVNYGVATTAYRGTTNNCVGV